ncbi:MAG: DUF3280 domain-containing protein [Methylovirgula sp.]
MKLSLAAAIAALLLPFAHAEAAPAKIMVFDFYLDNSSLEPTSAAETARIKTISDELRADLQKSGQYEVTPGSDIRFSSMRDIGKCTRDERAAAQKAGAELVACAWVQKVSNLILNLNLVIEDAKTGRPLHGGSIDIRGNTDETWDRGLRYLLKEHIFSQR